MQSSRPATLLKRDSAQVVSCEYYEIFQMAASGAFGPAAHELLCQCFLRVWLSRNNIS